ncbi:MAG: GDP-mannose 4,6-dehydratase, partial [Gaiellaceae bacterium]
LEGALASGAQLHELDVRDAPGVARVFAEVGPELVFHLAAQIDVRRSVSDPVFDASVNVLGAINLLAAAREHRAARVINSSTGGGLYGDAELLPTPEQHPIHPLAPYGQSKQAAEGYFELYTRLYGLSSVSLRYGNVYGPRQDVHGEAGVVAIFCGCLLEGCTPCVYGDGRQTRDWVDVADVVRANLLAAESGVSGPVNVAGGGETSVLDLVEALRAAGAARDLTLAEPRFLPARVGEVSRSRLDITRAGRELGWEPSVRLRDGLDRILSGII